MLEYEVYEETKEIIVKENDEELVKMNYLVEDSTAVIDSIKLTNKFEKNMGNSPLEYYFNFFKNATKELKQPLGVSRVVLKDFKAMKELDNYVVEEFEARGKTKVGMR